MNVHLVYRSDPRCSIKVLMTAHLVHRNAKSVPWASEEALALMGEQDLTGRDISPKTSKFSSSLEELDNRIFRGYCGAKEFGDPSPFHIKSKAHAEEEEMSEDEQRRFKLLGYIAEDNPVLDKPRSRKEKVARHQGQSPRASQRKAQVQWASHRSMMKEQF